MAEGAFGAAGGLGAVGSDLRLLLGQIHYQNKIFLRTPVAAFFTLFFPLILLVIFAAIFGNASIVGLGVTIAQFYTPEIGRAHVCTPVTLIYLVCRLLLEIQ